MARNHPSCDMASGAKKRNQITEEGFNWSKETMEMSAIEEYQLTYSLSYGHA